MLFHVLSKINGWNFSDFFAWSYSVIKRLKSLPLVFAGNNAFPHGEEGQNRIPRKGLQSKKKFSWRISEYARKKKNVLLETKFKIWICIYKIKQNLTINQCTKQLLPGVSKDCCSSKKYGRCIIQLPVKLHKNWMPSRISSLEFSKIFNTPKQLWIQITESWNLNPNYPWIFASDICY